MRLQAGGRLARTLAWAQNHHSFLTPPPSVVHGERYRCPTVDGSMIGVEHTIVLVSLLARVDCLDDAFGTAATDFNSSDTTPP